MGFIRRHLISILLVAAVLAWALIYLPTTPTWTVVQMKNAIDARNGDAAASYVDFDAVVTHAATEMVNKRAADNPVAGLIGSAALAVLEKPLAQVVRNESIAKVNSGDKDVQMPGFAAALAVVMIRRDGDVASTTFTDPKNQKWEIRMQRGTDGVWRVSQVDDIEQILQKVQEHEAKELNMN